MTFVDSASGLTFGSTINLSQSEGFSASPQVAVSENGNIYVVWEDTDTGAADIFFSASTNKGENFSSPVNISQSATSSSTPKIAVRGEDVYVVWVEIIGSGSEVLFASGSVDPDGTATFSGVTNLSNNPAGGSADPEIVASNGKIYVAWGDDIDGSSPPEIFFTNSTDNDLSFGPPINVSVNDGVSVVPKMSVSSSGFVYVAWQDDTLNPGSEQGIFFASSTNDGVSFASPVSISMSGGFAGISDVVTLPDDSAGVVWSDNGEVFFRSGTVDFAGVASFNPAVNVSNDPTSSEIPQFGVSGTGKINVIWRDDSVSTRRVLFTNSEDGGTTFSSPPTTIGNVTNFPSPQMVLSDSSNIFVVWDDGSEIFYSASTDDGATFSDPVNVSTNDEISEAAVIGAAGPDSHIAWVDFTTDNPEIFFRTVSTDAQPPIIIIEEVSDTNPKWGDEIEIIGTANGKEGDTVSIEWGDGSASNNIPISGSEWGPATHSYNSSATGSKQIFARVIDSSGTQKAVSEPEEIVVEKHSTNLLLSKIKSVIQGSNITVGGILTDLDNGGDPISGRTIRFNGTGSSGLATTTTDTGGEYLFQGPSDNATATLLAVQAVFAGDSAYQPSVSTIRTYDAAPSTAQVFVVPSGSPSHVDLPEFGASIDFDEVPSAGTIFVYPCDAPPSARYITLESSCIVISPSLDLNEGSGARITMSFDGVTLPEGHTLDEIDIFHEELSGIMDITESRNLSEKTVTGRTLNFSAFIMGVALHDPPSEDSMREQVFVGRNELAFNDISAKSFQFGVDEFELGSRVTVTVTDESANADSVVVESISARISSSSDAAGITLILNETGVDSGIFANSLALGSSSSSEEGILRAMAGDTVTGTYTLKADAPFKIILEDVAEAGLMEVRKYTVGPEVSFDAIGDAYNVILVDARLGSPNIAVTISYVNVPDEWDNAENFRLAQRSLPDPEGDIVWMDISLPNLPRSHVTSGLNTSEKTISGTSTFLSQFAIVTNFTPPGGGGGGLPRPGTGVILLDSATVARDEPRDSGGGGGGGGPRSAGVTQTPSGSDVETSVTTESGSVTLRFELVEAEGGQLKVSSSQLSANAEKFDDILIMVEDNDEHGIVRLDGATYSTAGTIFDIDASKVAYQGNVEATIPYDEEAVTLLSGSESNVRFLHYDKETGVWEDATSSVDELANTVTGILDSLSPVVAAVIINQGVTFDEKYFEENPLARLGVASASFSVSAEAEIELSATLNNMQGINQEYFVVAQILDENGIAQHIEWEKGSLASGGKDQISMIWKPEERGAYEVQVFVWDNADNPSALSDAILKDVVV